MKLINLCKITLSLLISVKLKYNYTNFIKCDFMLMLRFCLNVLQHVITYLYFTVFVSVNTFFLIKYCEIIF